jgi:hypothetical protein
MTARCVRNYSCVSREAVIAPVKMEIINFLLRRANVKHYCRVKV